MSVAIAPTFFEGQPLRPAKIGSKPWFVALDACFILYPEFNRYAGVGGYLKGLAEDERVVVKRKDFETMGIYHGPNVPPSLTLVSLPGLLKLIARSNRPEAVRFDRWVRHEVLPSIMDTGKYEVPGRAHSREASGGVGRRREASGGWTIFCLARKV